MALLQLLLNSEQIILSQKNEPLVSQVCGLISAPKQQKLTKQIANQAPSTVLKVLKLLCVLFYKFEGKHAALLNFYESILHAYAYATGNDTSNSLALSAFNMRAYLHLNNGNVPSAKTALKKVRPYLSDNVTIDESLMAISLSNLATIYMAEGQPEKALAYAKNALCLIQPYIDRLKENNKPFLESTVILVNVYFLLYQSLTKIIETNKLDEQLAGQYRNFVEIFYWEGYQQSREHLGKHSNMTRRFAKHRPSFLRSQDLRKKKLPLILKPNYTPPNHSSIISQILSAVQTRIQPQFQQIRDMISNYTPAPVSSQPRTSKYDFSDVTCIAQWRRSSDDLLITLKMFTPKKQQFGKVHIEIKMRERLVAEELLQQQMLAILVTQVGADALRPIGVHLGNCSEVEVLRYYLMPFIGLDGEKVSIWPKAPSLTQEKKVMFLDQECYVFVNYVSGNQMRLSVAPLDQCYSLHVDFEMAEDLAMTFMAESYSRNVGDFKKINMFRIAKGQSQLPPQPIPDPEVEPKLSNFHIFQTQFQTLMDRLEGFLIEHKFVTGEKNSIFSSNDIYLKAFLYQLGKISICGVHNFPEDFSLQILVENLYETHGPAGMIKAKGYASYEYVQLIKDFGVNLSQIRPFEQRQIFSMVASKYYLQVYQQPLTPQNLRQYGQNAMKQYPFQFKVFKRQYLLTTSGYMMPVTTCVLSLNAQTPIGIRMTAYDIDKSIEVGAFIKIQPELWVRPPTQKPKEQETKEGASKAMVGKVGQPVKDLNTFISNYMVATVLEQGGFRAILNGLVCQYVDGNLTITKDNKEVRWCRLEEVLTYQKFKAVERKK